MAPIAVTLLTGFLGAGKTTLLRHILNEQHGFKIAVIENEFGEVSVDDQLIGDRATQIKTLTNGCICCTRSNELEDALLDLLDSRDRGEIEFDRLVIECTGMRFEHTALPTSGQVEIESIEGAVDFFLKNSDDTGVSMLMFMTEAPPPTP